MPRLVRTGLSSIRYLARALGGFPVAVDILTVGALATAIAAPGSVVARWAVVAMAALVLGRIAFEWWQARMKNVTGRLWMGTKTLPRIATAGAALAVGLRDDGNAALVAAAAMLMVLVVGEQTIRRPVKAAVPQVAHLGDWHVPMPSTTLGTAFFMVDTIGITLLAVAAAFDVTALPALAAGAVGIVLTVPIALQAVRFLVRRNRLEAQLPKILNKLGPVFAFHWQAPAGTAYQASMWLPYLDRIGVPYFVLVRTVANFHEVRKMTDAPVILRVGLEDLDRVVCPSLKVVFYANTAVRNSHMIRFPHLTHIQLNHGDSDKIASVSPTFRQYDRNFVAGQAAIDRFATHGVQTLPDQFEIVGRPQLEHVQQAMGPISAASPQTVLYSPTWSGFYDDSDYSSLSAGRAIVEALLARGCVVVFRPHPYARRHPANARNCAEVIELLARDARETGRPHVYGPAAETQMSVVDCFNAADAMISDVSSLASDFLISSKPFAMAAVSAHGEAFLENFPLGRAAYVFDVVGGTAVGLPELLDDMLGADSRAEGRRAMRSYYLSDTPPERIAERFLETARRYL
jgi:hypothetical protein